MMEARPGKNSRHFYDGGASDLNGIGKKSFEWDLNNWTWDGERFIATPVNAVSSDGRNKQLFQEEVNGVPSNSSSSGSEETNSGIAGKARGEAEKRRRVLVVGEDELYDGTGSLSLKLGGHAYPITETDLAAIEENKGKSKLHRGNSSQPSCQVEGCEADLRTSKDYHRRHKVCEMHSKATQAVVGNAIQRFCQQCSRFHLLQEFDEGKRSCRRRLAGHNKRRRKTHPDAAVGGTPSIDDRTSSYLLISLLKILSSLHSDSSERANDQDLLSHLLRNLASLAGSFDARNLSGLLQSSENPQKLGTSAGTSSEAADALVSNSAPAPGFARLFCSTSEVARAPGGQIPLNPTDNLLSVAAKTNVVVSPEPTVYTARTKDFDLNDTYNDAHDCGEGFETQVNHAYLGTGFPNCSSQMLQDSRQSSPPQMSGNSDSTSGRTLSSSNGDAQCRTDRIVFKLFGKNPHDFPLVLRAQILDWLSNSPTDIESYIRPGCVILTVYLRLAEPAWEELCDHLSSYLDRLLSSSTGNFWTSGWIYARVQHQIAFICKGQVVLDIPLPLRCPDHSKILFVKPIAVPHSTTVNFIVKGFNLAHSSTRLLCSFEGRYLVQDTTQALVEGTIIGADHEGPECLTFSCSLPDARGRGFIEVEDHGLSNDFFPFIVAEQEICSEICVLESALDIAMCEDHYEGREDKENIRNQSLEFLNELGWLLRRSSFMCMSDKMEPCPNVFHLERFRWLVAFAMDHDWCAVIKKLLDILFSGTVDLSGQSPREVALSENLLHIAVRRNCKSMVELLLKYKPDKKSKDNGAERLLFRPDILGPSNITPLHIAAASSGAESVVDALISDPEAVGINAWKSARDSIGFTPEDYARAQGHESYLQLVQKKIDRQLEKAHVVVGIPGDFYNMFADGPKSGNVSFEVSKKMFRSTVPYCNLCSRQMAHRSSGARTLLYRPAMLAMVGIAAVCVCVGLLFKSPPEVFYVFPSFRWELLGYGSI